MKYIKECVALATVAQQLDASGNNWFREANAGTARLAGFEAELQAEPLDGLRVDSSFGYVNYLLLDNGGNTLLFTGNNCDGERCYSQRTPKYTSSRTTAASRRPARLAAVAGNRAVTPC